MDPKERERERDKWVDKGQRSSDIMQTSSPWVDRHLHAVNLVVPTSTDTFHKLEEKRILIEVGNNNDNREIMKGWICTRGYTSM